MLRNALLAAVILLAALGPAEAESIQAALKDFELLGTWAVDCDRTPSAMNENVIYSAPKSGDGSQLYQFGRDYPDKLYIIHGAERAADDKLLLHEQDVNDGSFLDVVIVKTKDKTRVLSSVGKNATVHVENAKIKLNGLETQWVVRCGK
jgi:hypothetical protein